MTKVLTVASGKGGVGKTSIGLNLSLALAGGGSRVCLFDADLGLANVNILTGLYPEHGLADVILNQTSLSEIMIRNYNGIDIIPGSSGVERLADLSREEAVRLVDAFLTLDRYDYFILDTSAGISAQVLAFCRASQEIVLVVTPEPTSLTDAYSLLKVLSCEAPLPKVRVVINQVRTAAAAKQAYAKLKRTARKFLSLSLSPLGIVVRDNKVPIAVASQIPFMLLFPNSAASRCIRAMGRKLRKDSDGEIPVDVFWDQCLNLLAKERKSGPETVSLSRPDTGGADVVALEKRLDALDHKLSGIMKEVLEIKTLLSRNGSKEASVPLPRESGRGDPAETSQQILALDFETWLKDRQAKIPS